VTFGAKPKHPVNILLVDDRPDGIFALEAILRSPEYNLVTARSGEEALRHFLRDDFAVVLLDVQMPGMDGFETARMMRRYESSRKTPIIFVTAINFEERYVLTGYESGAVDYIFKPFDSAILRSKVAVFVDLYLMHAELQRQADMSREVERMDRERTLQEFRLEGLRRYKTLADALPHMVWRAQPDGSVDYFNKVWCDYTGLSAEESADEGWHACFDSEDRTKLIDVWQNAKGAPFELECRIIRGTDHSPRWHLVRAVPELDERGDVLSWIVSCTEIHDRKVVEEQHADLLKLEQAARWEMIQARDAAEVANRAKSQILANMSHEIRTPLGIVLGLAELLLEQNQPPAERRESIETILRNGRQLSKLVDDILDISKIEAGKLELDNTDFSLPDLVNDVVATMTFQAAQKGLELKLEMDDSVPASVRSDPLRIRQIFTNVIGNALKFTDKGQVSVRVESESPKGTTGAVCIKITVEDTGVGIAETLQSRLFQDFMQADATMTRRFGGTGLGLALSRRLAHHLGGDLRLEQSRLGEGSRFSIRIKVEALAPARQDGKIAGGRDLDALRVDGVRVLLVEDLADNQYLVSRLLKRAGASVDVAQDGGEGIDCALRSDYDVVLMDIQMPNVDGLEATERLRAGGYDRPIIALTAHAMKEERDRCLAKGFTDHLPKPIDRRELLVQVRKHAGVV
jgi:PAS domain S-box-containing protein